MAYGKLKMPIEVLLWTKVERKGRNECWPWLGGLQKSGHSYLTVDGVTRRAYRVGYERVFGPIPDGMCVCHSCDHGWCMNPYHWFLGTQQDNLSDMRAKGRHTHRLSEREIREMRSLRESGYSYRQLSAKFRISLSHVCRIIRRESWPHII